MNGVKEVATGKTAIIEAATKYLSAGFSVVPVDREKRPKGRWKEFQSRRMAVSEIEQFFKDADGVGIVTGQISGLVVLDVESGEDVTDLNIPPTVTAISGGGGLHFYFRFSPDAEIRNSGGFMNRKIDVRGEGGYAVAPPSLHPSGERYAWKKGCAPGEIPLADVPDWLKKEQSRGPGLKNIAFGVPEGQRNNAATRMAGKLIGAFPRSEWEGVVWPLLVDWNNSNSPPLELLELRTIYGSIAAHEMEKGRTEDSWHIWSMSEIFQYNFPPNEWLVDRLMPLGSITALSGNPGSYKSWLALCIAKAVATGNNFLGRFPVIPGAVLIVDEEDQLGHLQKRLSMLGVPAEAPIHYLSQSGVMLDNDRHVTKMQTFIEERGIKLVIVDSLVRVHSGDENDARDMARLFRNIRKLTAAGATILVIHHHRKAVIGQTGPQQSLRGSSDILASLDCHLAVDAKDGKITVKQTKLRQDKAMDPFTVSVETEQNPGRIEFLFGGTADLRELKEKEAEEAILSLFVEGKVELPRTEIHVALTDVCGRNAIDEGLAALAATGKLILFTEGPGRPHIYRLPV